MEIIVAMIFVILLLLIPFVSIAWSHCPQGIIKAVMKNRQRKKQSDLEKWNTKLFEAVDWQKLK